MTNSMSAVGRTSIWVVAMALLAVPARMHASPPDQAATRRDRAAEYTLSLDVELASAGPDGNASDRTTSRTIRLADAAILHRFRVTGDDSVFLATGREGRWVATVIVGSGAGDGARHAARLHLSSNRREFTLPSPLGLLVDAGDVVVFEVTQAGGARSSERLRLFIDGDKVDGPATRLGVVAMAASAHRDGMPMQGLATERGEVTWEWSPAVDGRILAIAGSVWQNTRDLVLEDVTTGERLWELTSRGDVAYGALSTAGDVIRLGVPVQAGRVYRLRATLRGVASGDHGAASGTLVALLLPVRHVAAR